MTILDFLKKYMYDYEAEIINYYYNLDNDEYVPNFFRKIKQKYGITGKYYNIRINALNKLKTKNICLYNYIIKKEYKIYQSKKFINNLVNDFENIERKIDNEVLINIYNKLFKELSLKEVLIIKLRYGLDGNNYHTLEEISKIFNLSKERIRQIECKTIRRIKYRVKRSQEYKLLLNIV